MFNICERRHWSKMPGKRVMSHRSPVTTLRIGPAVSIPELGPHPVVRDSVVIAGLYLWIAATTFLVPPAHSSASRHSHSRHRRSTSRSKGGRSRSCHGSESRHRSSSRRCRRDRSVRHSRVHRHSRRRSRSGSRPVVG